MDGKKSGGSAKRTGTKRDESGQQPSVRAYRYRETFIFCVFPARKRAMRRKREDRVLSVITPKKVNEGGRGSVSYRAPKVEISLEKESWSSREGVWRFFRQE